MVKELASSLICSFHVKYTICTFRCFLQPLHYLRNWRALCKNHNKNGSSTFRQNGNTKTTLLILDPEKRYSFAVPLLSTLWKRTFSYFPFVCLFVCLPGPVGVEWCPFVSLSISFPLVSSLSQHKWLELTRSLLYLCSPSSYKNDFLSIHTVWIRSTWGTVFLLL